MKATTVFFRQSKYSTWFCFEETFSSIGLVTSGCYADEISGDFKAQFLINTIIF